MITVVSAAIVDRSVRRILLAQRAPAPTTYPYLWCTPGGKVEAGETHREALGRELSEEIRVVLTGDLGLMVYERGVVSTRTGEPVRVVCYLVFADKLLGKPMPLDGTIGLDWCSCGELPGKLLAPADNAERGTLVRLLSSF